MFNSFGGKWDERDLAFLVKMKKIWNYINQLFGEKRKKKKDFFLMQLITKTLKALRWRKKEKLIRFVCCCCCFCSCC